MTQDITKNASSEIAQSRERFEKWYDSESYDDCDSYVHRRMGEAYEQAERDTRELVYQLLQSEASLYEINGRECDASGNTIGGFGDVNAAIALKRMAERIRGKE